ncbi:antitoxin MazE-like protein [Rhizobium sp. YIM 134829]|uniref:antitoxin MazE-like protein n=1 Tax=Rhizobium sp. YIM 134829 TaxID=3390453 RepID=UPI003978CAFA
MGRPRELSPEERADLLRQGYRPIEIWVPDFSSPTYRAEAARQAQSSVQADRREGLTDLLGEADYQDWDEA